MKWKSLLLISIIASSMIPVQAVAQEKANGAANSVDIPTDGLEAEVKKNYPEALRIYKASLAKNPNNPTLWKRISDIELSLKNYPAAADALNQAIKIQPNVENYANLSGIYSSANKPQDSLDAMEKAIKLDPKNIANLKEKADLADWVGDLDKEEETYKRILKLDPNNKDAINGLNRVAAQRAEAAPPAPTPEPTPAPTEESATPTTSTSSSTSAWSTIMKPFSNTEETPPETKKKGKRKGKATSSEVKETPAENPDTIQSTAAQYGVILGPEPTAPTTSGRQKTKATTGQKTQATETETETGAGTPTYTTSASYGTAEYYAQRSMTLFKEDRKTEALDAIDEAVDIDPENVRYLEMQAKIASDRDAVGDYEIAENSYDRILNIRYSKKTLLEKARFNRDQNHLDQATIDYRNYLRRYPDSKEVLIEYAQILRWKGDMRAAECALAHYRSQYGRTDEFYKEEAALLAVTSRPKRALNLLDDLLAEHPNDYDLMSSKARALNANHQISEALDTYDEMEHRYPNNFDDNQTLRKELITPIRPNLNVGIGSSHDSDTITMLPVRVYGQYFINPETSVEIGANRTYMTVDSDEPALFTVDGQNKMRFANEWLGVRHQFAPEFALGAQGGAAHTQNAGGFFTYKVNATVTPIDRLALNFFTGRELYALSPLSTSLKTKKIYNRATVNWEPWTERYIVLTAERAHYSDNNKSYMLGFAPSAGVIRSQYVSLDLGIDASWQGFSFDPANGYYAPKTQRTYEVTSLIYISQSDNVGYTIFGGIGVQKDETMRRFGFAGDAYVQGVYGIYQDWQLSLTAGATRSNGGGGIIAGKNYYAYSFEALVTRRF